MVLKQCEVIQRICQPLFVEKNEIFIHFRCNIAIAGHMKIGEQLGFDPAIAVIHQLLNEAIEKRKEARLMNIEAKQNEATSG